MPNNKSQKELRKAIWGKSGGVCSHCGRKVASEKERTIDHVIPKILGGGNDSRNLMPLCAHCNKSRASGEIIPETYYRYAQQWAMEELRSYILEWKLSHTTAAGTMTVDRFGIIERPAPSAQ